MGCPRAYADYPQRHCKSKGYLMTSFSLYDDANISAFPGETNAHQVPSDIDTAPFNGSQTTALHSVPLEYGNISEPLQLFDVPRSPSVDKVLVRWKETLWAR